MICSTSRPTKPTSVNLVASTLRKGAPMSLAIRRAISVLPTPVGPIMRMFLGVISSRSGLGTRCRRQRLRMAMAVALFASGWPTMCRFSCSTTSLGLSAPSPSADAGSSGTSGRSGSGCAARCTASLDARRVPIAHAPWTRGARRAVTPRARRRQWGESIASRPARDNSAGVLISLMSYSFGADGRFRVRHAMPRGGKPGGLGRRGCQPRRGGAGAASAPTPRSGARLLRCPRAPLCPPRWVACHRGLGLGLHKGRPPGVPGPLGSAAARHGAVGSCWLPNAPRPRPPSHRPAGHSAASPTGGD